MMYMQPLASFSKPDPFWFLPSSSFHFHDPSKTKSLKVKPAISGESALKKYFWKRTPQNVPILGICFLHCSPVTVPEKTITEWEAVEGRTPTVCRTNSRLQANQLTPAQLTQPLEPDATVLPRRRSQRKFPGPAGILPPAVRVLTV